MKNILITYDFSESAINALNYTKKLFEGQSVNIFLIDVYIVHKSSLISEEKSSAWFKEMDNEIENELEYLVNVLNKEDKGFTYNYIVEADSLVNAIHSQVKNKKIDLIVSGTKGAKSLKENFIGTNTLKVIDAIKSTPIIVVPTAYKYKSIKHIVFSTNYKQKVNDKEITALTYISALKKSAIEVVNLSEDKLLTEKQKNNKLELQSILKGLEVDFLKLDWQKSETDTIQEHINRTAGNLLVFINHKHNFFNAMLSENVIKNFSFNSTIPLLILPELN